jgi:hypothetical protein
VKGEFFCGNCRRFLKLEFRASTRPNGVAQCTFCREKAIAARAKRATDVIGEYPNGKPLLRKHDTAHREKAKRARYASGSCATFFKKAGIA